MNFIKLCKQIYKFLRVPVDFIEISKQIFPCQEEDLFIFIYINNN